MAYYVPSDKDEYKKSWSYTPGSAAKDNGNGSYTTSGGYTLKNNYTTDKVTPGMSYAIKQSGGNPNAARAADKYVEDLMGRIGTTSANTGQTLTAADIQKELNRLGYSANTNGDWMTVGGQQFLVGSNDYNNLKNKLNDIGRGNMNIYTGQYMNNGANGAGGSLSGNYDGNLGYSSYMDAYAKALQAQLDRIDEQKRLAQDNEDREKRQAYVAMKLGQKALNEQNAASGLQDSGYSEQSNIALTADYGNNLNTISNNYQQYLNDLAGTYADTALSGAGTMADLAQQDYANRVAAQKYADQMKQQDLENQWYEREYADSQKAKSDELAYEQSKAKADAAINLGIWSPEIESIYGVSKEDYTRALQAQLYSASSGSSSRRSSSSSRSASSSGGGEVSIDEIIGDDDGLQGGGTYSTYDELKNAGINPIPSRKAALGGVSPLSSTTSARVSALVNQFGLDSQTAQAVVNTAQKTGISLGESYYQYITQNGNDAQKKNATALAKSVDKYVK